MTESRYDKTEQSARLALSELDFPEETHTRCLAILGDKRTQEIITEQNTDGIIAGAIYIAAILTENRITQQSLADVMEVSQASIRKYYVMLAKLLELKRKES